MTPTSELDHADHGSVSPAGDRVTLRGSTKEGWVDA